MPEFEMLNSERIEFNNGGEFLELSVNVVKDGKRETPYLRLARGFYGSDGEPRYKKGGCTLPIDRQVLADLAEALKTWDISQAEAMKGSGGGDADEAAPKKASKKKAAAADDDA